MSLSYDGKKLIPAPLVTLNKTYNKTGVGNTIGVLYSISLDGTILPFRGSPSGNYGPATEANLLGAFWDLPGDPPDEPFEANNEDFNHLLRKQEAIRFLFSTEGKSLEWQPSEGQPVVKCNPRVLNIDFEPGTWNTRTDYNISLEADKVFLPTGPLDDEDLFDPKLLQSASEDWSFQENLGTVGSGYVITHTVAATAKTGYDELGDLQDNKEAWEHAADFVKARTIGVVDPAIISGVLGVDPWLGGNYTTATTVDEETGTFTTIETFLLQQETTFTSSTFSIAETPTQDFFEVNLNGTITALDPGGRLGNRQAIDNAKNAVPSNSGATAQAEDILSEFLNGRALGEPSNKNIAINQGDGIVTFDFTWAVGEDLDFTKETEATLNFVADTGEFTVDLSCRILGKGATKQERVDNAKTQIPTDSEALTIATDLLGSQIPGGLTFDDSPRNKGISINESQGTVQATWTFGALDVAFGGFKMSVNTVFPADVVAEIAIPGRIEGPILQDLNTQTSQTITVSLISENNTSKPDNTTVVDAMNDAGSIDPTWFLVSDDEDFDLVTNNYSRSRTHLVRPV